MAEIFTPIQIDSIQNDPSATSQMNSNFSTIATLFNDVLSRSGTAPNQMLSSLDMNNNRIINVPTPVGLQDPLRLQDALTPLQISIITVASNVNANTIYAGPTSGSPGLPSFRSIVSADIPASLTIVTPTISSPSLTGIPTAPTAAVGTNTTQIATTAFVQAASVTACTNSGSFRVGIGAGSTQCSDVAGSVANLNGGPLKITAGLGTLPSASSVNAVIQATFGNGVQSSIVIDSFASTPGSFFIGRSARGTAAAQTALQTNNIITAYNMVGHDGFVYSGNRGGMFGFAAQNWAPGAHGTFIEFCTTPNNTTACVTDLHLDQNGSITVPVGPLNITPTVGTYNQGLVVSQPNPSTAGGAGPYAYNLIDVTHKSTVTGAGTDGFGLINSNADALRVNMTIATGAGGFPIANGIFATRITATGTFGDVVSLGAGLQVSTVVSSGGGFFEAFNPYAFVTASGAFTGTLVSAEVTTGIATGGSATNRVNLAIINADAVQGTSVDYAILIGNIGPSTGAFKKGIVLSNLWGAQPPIATTGDFIYVDAAYTIANFANATNLTVTGNILNFQFATLSGSGLMALSGPPSASNQPVVTANKNTATPISLGAFSNVFHGVGANTTNTVIGLDGYGTGVQPVFTFRRARGTGASPTAAQSGDAFGIITWVGATGAGTYADITGAAGGSFILGRAKENWSGTNQGSSLEFFTTPTTTAAAALALTIQASGGISIGSATDPAAGGILANVLVQSPLIKGGTGAGSTLELRSTSGTGSGDKVFITGGTNGGTTVAGFFGSANTVTLGSGITPSNTTVLITRNTTMVLGSLSTLGNALVTMAAVDGTSTGLQLSGFGTGNNSFMAATQARGTAASPTALSANDVILSFLGLGYDGTNYDLGGGFSVVATAVVGNTSVSGGVRVITENANTPKFSWFTPLGGLMLLNNASYQSASDPGQEGLFINGQTYAPNITQTSAAQTGTVCWTSGGSPAGKFTVDTTVGCLTSIAATKNVTSDIDPYEALNMVDAMRPVSFRYRPGYGDSGRYEQFGLLAEEIAAIDERMVGRDIEGTLRGVHYMELTAVLAAAIKELKTEIDKVKKGKQ